jgi:hypothetical protein
MQCNTNAPRSVCNLSGENERFFWFMFGLVVSAEVKQTYSLTAGINFECFYSERNLSLCGARESEVKESVLDIAYQQGRMMMMILCLHKRFNFSTFHDFSPFLSFSPSADNHNMTHLVPSVIMFSSCWHFIRGNIIWMDGQWWWWWHRHGREKWDRRGCLVVVIVVVRYIC